MTSQTQHTPGPWNADFRRPDGTILISSASGCPLAAIGVVATGGCQADEANAALIARAPDLLAENERLKGELAWMTESRDTQNRLKSALQQQNAKLLEAAKYYLNVMDEVLPKGWRKDPDHVARNFIDAIAKNKGAV